MPGQTKTSLLLPSDKNQWGKESVFSSEKEHSLKKAKARDSES
jgi:hypothetical protein